MFIPLHDLESPVNLTKTSFQTEQRNPSFEKEVPKSSSSKATAQTTKPPWSQPKYFIFWCPTTREATLVLPARAEIYQMEHIWIKKATLPIILVLGLGLCLNTEPLRLQEVDAVDKWTKWITDWTWRPTQRLYNNKGDEQTFPRNLRFFNMSSLKIES